MKSRTPLTATPIFVVELLEPFVSKWMFIELAHASRIVGRDNLWLYNVKRECELAILSRIAARVEQRSIISALPELAKEYSVILLDPAATRELSPEDFTERTLVIVGGIMGANPPRGRTRRELTEKVPVSAAARSIGPWQFTIDGAIYVARKVAGGASLSDIPVTWGLTLRDGDREVFLPYAFPVENGRAVISEEEINYVLGELEEDEARAIASGEAPTIC